MARRLDALAPTQHPERMSFNKDRVLDRGRTAFGDRSSAALPPVRSAMRSASVGDVKVAPGKAADEETPEHSSPELLLRELVDGQREQTAKLACIEARIGAPNPDPNPNPNPNPNPKPALTLTLTLTLSCLTLTLSLTPL